MSIAIIYGGTNGTTRGINSYFNEKGLKLKKNGVEIIRVNTDSLEYSITNEEIDSIKEIYVLGGNINNVPKRLKDKILELGVIEHSLKDTLKEINDQSRRNDRYRRVSVNYRGVLVAGFIDAIILHYKIKEE